VQETSRKIIRRLAVVVVALAGMAAFASPMAAAAGTVEPRDPTSFTSFTASPNPASPFQAVTLTANLLCTRSAATQPTGPVSFFQGNPPVLLGTVLAPTGHPSADNWTYSLGVPSGTLPAGTSTLTATYPGGAAGAVTCSAASTTTTVTVTATSVAVSTTPTSPTAGSPATLEATVTCTGDGVPTGTVQFSVNGNPVDGPVPVSSSGPNTGTASVPFTFPAPGSQAVTASFTSTNPACTVAGHTTTVLVGAATPTTSNTALSPSNTTPFFLQQVIFTSVVNCNDSGSVAGGTVTFSDNGVPFATVPVVPLGENTGIAQTSRTFFFGSHVVTATFSGTSTCGPSTSNAVTITPTFLPFSGTADAPGQQQVAGVNDHANKRAKKANGHAAVR
jgi:hypothetical protein